MSLPRALLGKDVLGHAKNTSMVCFHATGLMVWSPLWLFWQGEKEAVKKNVSYILSGELFDKFHGAVWSFPWCRTVTSTELEGGQRAEFRRAVKDSSRNIFETSHCLYPFLFSGVQNTFLETKDRHCLTLSVRHFIQQTFLTPYDKKDNMSELWEINLFFAHLFNMSLVIKTANTHTHTYTHKKKKGTNFLGGKIRGF